MNIDCIKNIRCLAILLSFLLPFSVEAHDSNLMQPDDPEAPVPVTIYHSTFIGYQPFQKLKLQSWRQVNDKAGKSDGMDMDHMNMKNMNMKNMNMNEMTPDKKNNNNSDHSSHVNH